MGVSKFYDFSSIIFCSSDLLLYTGNIIYYIHKTNSTMDVQTSCFILLVGLILLSGVYLIVILKTYDLPYLHRIRAINFLFEHLLGLILLLKRRITFLEEDTLYNLYLMICYTGINFTSFIGI